MGLPERVLLSLFLQSEIGLLGRLLLSSETYFESFILLVLLANLRIQEESGSALSPFSGKRFITITTRRVPSLLGVAKTF